MERLSSYYSTSSSERRPSGASVDRILSRQRFLMSYKFSTTSEERKVIQKTKETMVKKKHYLQKKVTKVFSSAVEAVKAKCARLHMSGIGPLKFRAKHQHLVEN
ncbi:hypothetical protein R6Q59_005647 [Mikania micrantha]